jgi:hypothetical protein
MEKNGRTTGFLNTKDGFIDVHQIKFAEQNGELDRANFQYADVSALLQSTAKSDLFDSMTSSNIDR